MRKLAIRWGVKRYKKARQMEQLSGVRARKINDRIETSFSEGVFDGRYHPTIRPMGEESTDAHERRLRVVIESDQDKQQFLSIKGAIGE